MVLGEVGRLLLTRPSAMQDWQPGETKAWVLGMVANLFSVKFYRMFLNIREIGVTRENKRSHLFQRMVGDSSVGETPRKELFILSGSVLRLEGHLAF